MGMSGDYEVAIECGSNMVRVGSAIFGEAKPEDGRDGEGRDGDGRDGEGKHGDANRDTE